MRIRHWISGIIWGSLGAAIIAGIMAYQNWRLNPSGIFYNAEEGTNWDFVSDTFFSWFWPAIPWLVVTAWLITYLFYLLKKIRSKG